MFISNFNYQTDGIMQNTTKNTSNKKNNKYHYKLPGLGCSKPANLVWVRNNITFLSLFFLCSFFFCFLRAELELDLREKSSKEPQGEDQGAREIPTESQILGLIASKYLKATPIGNRDDVDDFLRYLQEMRALITSVRVGSVIITVICTSLEILEVLWEDCNTGHMNEVAQKLLITNDVIREFGDVKITVTMLEEEYKACRAHFLQSSGKP